MKKFYKNLNTLFGLYKIQKDRVDAQIKEFELDSSNNPTITTLLGEVKTLAENDEFDKDRITKLLEEFKSLDEKGKSDNLSIKNFLDKVKTLAENGELDKAKTKLLEEIKSLDEKGKSDNLTIKNLLGEVKTLAENGEFDKSWQYLHQIDLLKVDSADDEWLAARKISLEKESVKFDDKRKNAVAELIQTVTKVNIKEAILTRNKFYDTHYHKIAIRTKNLGILIVLLVIAIIFIFIESSFYDCPLETANLVRSATYGLLGAVLSMALTLTSKPLDEKIPDLVIGIRVTWLRPIIGIAAGIVSLMVVNTAILKTLFSAELVGNVTIIAFIAGFSERFIISIVDILAKK